MSLDQQILAELQKLNRRMDTLNTRLFGNPEGDAGDEGRLVVLERRMNNHSGHISKLEQFRWYLLGGFIVADILFLYALHLREARLLASFPQSVQKLAVSLPVSRVFQSGSDYYEPLPNIPK